MEIKDGADAKTCAETFGLQHGNVAFLSHCGSRGFGHDLAAGQFRDLQEFFETWGTPLPAGDKQLVYAPLGTPQADAYLDDMALGANFATVNHMLINALVLEAFQEVLPGTEGQLVYFISHNIARQEVLENKKQWVHRKGATRAFPAGHHALKETPFADTGHPILLPGNPRDGSVVMAALPGAEKSCFSVNHGAGRRMGRKAAFRALDQKAVDADFAAQDILTNCRNYPRRMGVEVSLELERYGFFPAGGGAIVAAIAPCSDFKRINLQERGGPLAHEIRVVSAHVADKIGQREAAEALAALAPYGWSAAGSTVTTVDSSGAGNVVAVVLRSENVCEMTSTFGERGKSGKRVALEAAKGMSHYLGANAVVGRRLADQLLLPMSLAGCGEFVTMNPSNHTLTNAAMIEQFLDVTIEIVELEAGQWKIAVHRNP
ncbi:MAG: hypothetical protein ACI9R3_003242 [Verrucomicrobiales bacterium]